MRTNGTAKAAASHGEAGSRVATYAYPPQRSAVMTSTKGCSSRLIGIPAAIMQPGNEPSASYLAQVPCGALRRPRQTASAGRTIRPGSRRSGKKLASNARRCGSHPQCLRELAADIRCHPCRRRTEPCPAPIAEHIREAEDASDGIGWRTGDRAFAKTSPAPQRPQPQVRRPRHAGELLPEGSAGRRLGCARRNALAGFSPLALLACSSDIRSRRTRQQSVQRALNPAGDLRDLQEPQAQMVCDFSEDHSRKISLEKK